MKKIKAFTLLEMIIVVAIIWIVSASLIGAKRNIAKNIDTWREAVNIMYKEMDQYLKDFQRNKIREDNDENTYEIDYFKIYFWDENIRTGNELTVWNVYNNDDNYFNSWTLISWQKYAAFQYLKWAEKYTFYTRNKSGTESTIQEIKISNWKIYKWSSNYPNNPENGSEYQFVICWWEWWKIEHIWAITINAITKESRLDRCETEKYSWIDCGIFTDC